MGKESRLSLINRKEQLIKICNEKRNALQNVPEGSLRISSSRNRVQYYLRNDPKNFVGSYIAKKDLPMVQQLAQKEYDKKILTSAEQEIHAIDQYLKECPKRYVEEVYESMHIEKQKLVIPILETVEQFVKKWQQNSYEGKTFAEDAPALFTAKGERVRSKSEVIIADLLEREKIPYHYEKPIWLKGWRNVYPDFTVLNVLQRKEIYWEHLGMMDDPEYAEKAIQKIEMYQKNHIFPGDNLILTYETKNFPLNQKNILNVIQHYLKN